MHKVIYTTLSLVYLILSVQATPFEPLLDAHLTEPPPAFLNYFASVTGGLIYFCGKLSLFKSPWIKDLTQEGIEPNPGPGRNATPTSKRSRRSHKNKAFGNQSVFDPALNKKPEGNIPRVPRCDYNTNEIRRSTKVTEIYTMEIRDQSNSTIVTGPSPTAGAFDFELASDVANASAYEALFDQYRVIEWHAVFRPKQNVTLDGINTAYSQPLYIVIDFDDSTALTSVAQATQYDSCVQLEAYQSCKRSFVPMVNVPSFSGSTFSASTGLAAPWIDIAFPSVKHYGLKWYSPSQGTTFIPVWELEFIYKVQFRNSR